MKDGIDHQIKLKTITKVWDKNVVFISFMNSEILTTTSNKSLLII